ncbi:uncharacterized protein LOC115620273 [Scaptodrosophila lebanonensis]|uniref:Uncharacterized protein LOC115620273 n=1 Tax=Drosophila lebanonensis TaxID=7225 RepID=A0A6J2T222_DROLE|nr:uncharacterized protein LOC115620273 [Scaptodrosophila lebanonensis]
MQLKTSFFLVLLGLSLILAAQLKVKIKVDPKIEKLKAETKQLAEVHADFSPSCFSYYSPILSGITDQYEAEYGVCVSNYDNATAAINTQWQAQREAMQNSIYNSCNSLQSCNNANSSLTAFECIANTSAEDSKIFYGISSNATDAAAKIKDQYNVAESQQTICINNAETVYVTQTTSTYEELNSCLKNGYV